MLEGHIEQPQRVTSKSRLLKKRPFRRMSSDVQLLPNSLQEDSSLLEANLSLRRVAEQHTFVSSPLEPHMLPQNKRRSKQQLKESRVHETTAADTKSNSRKDPGADADKTDEEVLVCPPAPKLRAIQLPKVESPNINEPPNLFTSILIQLMLRQRQCPHTACPFHR